MTTDLLRVENLCVCYGNIKAIHDVSFHLAKGEILSLIGANGAGKTSTLRAISGLLPLASGRVLLRGEDISELPAHLRVKRRMYQCPEGRGIFLNLSVEENLDLGTWAAPRDGKDSERLEYVFHLFPKLKERRAQNAGTLSGGEQQMLAIARALMGDPEILLLDEPSLGLAPQIIERIFGIIQAINRDGKTILLVEQNAAKALEIAHRGVVLETGKKVAEAPARDLLQSDEIRKAYLGD